MIAHEDEYLNPADGLIHCRKCRGPRQTRIQFNGDSFASRCVCPCQQEKERHRREAEERRQRMERIRRRKTQGLQDRYLYGYTFANDNGENPVMKKIHAYVDHWPEAFKKNIGLLLFGDVGTGKSFAAGCIANTLLDQDIPVLIPDSSRLVEYSSTRQDTASNSLCPVCRCQINGTCSPYLPL